MLVCLLILIACGSDPIATCEGCAFTCISAEEADVVDNTCGENWDCSFTVFSNSKVAIDDDLGKGRGSKKFFLFTNSTEGDPGILDDEFEYYLIFDLDESQTSFSVQDAELERLNVHYRILCFCMELEFNPVIEGCMQGEKQIDGSWLIQGSIMTPLKIGASELKFDARFEN